MERYPPGRQPYDPVIGLRVGGVAGAAVGGVVTALTGLGTVWLIVAGAIAGGSLGYVRERRRLQDDAERDGDEGRDP